MEFSNSEKNIHGMNNQKSVGIILDFCQQQGYIINVIEKFYAGKKGYKNTKQFYASFLIEFEDGEKWIIYTTTSLRDRIKAPQWDSFNLKAEYHDITTSLLVYPDGAPKNIKNQFISKNAKYRDKVEFSAIDAIINHTELNNLIEEHYLKNISKGRANDKKGNVFERKIASILSAPDNLLKWKYNKSTDVGTQFNTFQMIVDCLHLNPKNIMKINATSDKRVIGTMGTGGSPKTDVLVTVTYNDNSEEIFTISCKRTNNKEVSVHQYNADAFADVLDKDNDELRYLLNEFQRVGSLRDFGTEKTEKLTELLTPLNDKLALWVLAGIGGQGDPKKHWAQYLLTYNDSTDGISIHSIEEYIENLKETNTKGQLGTFFKWTYASGRKGKDIQLKTKIV